MCGIFGQFNAAVPLDKAIFNQKRDTLIHRGPDGADSWFSEDGKRGLGFRRLSFLDLSEKGMQPLCNEDGSLWLCVNGEIYNYLELKEELIKKGHCFRSETDSEVILHGYEEWGVQVLEKIKGMFAIALWDEKNRQLLLARDRFGIKPLYYSIQRNNLYFASELKAIIRYENEKPPLNTRAISQYLSYRFIPSPFTIWENCFKVPPAHYLLIDLARPDRLQGPLEAKSYWNIDYTAQKMPARDTVEQVDHLLSRSVSQHLRSDVPIGSFLSGGYDSSALVYYMTKAGYRPNTFAIGFDNWPESEHHYAQLVAEHLEVPFHQTIVGSEQLGLLDKLVYNYDEPIGDISIIPTYMVSQLAAQKNKAVFSGEGADEMFGGYWWQKAIADTPAWLVWWQKMSSMMGARPDYFVEKYADAMSMGRYTHDNLPGLLHPDLHASIPSYADAFYEQHYRKVWPPIKSFQYMDVKSFMSELVLVKIDRASMAHSLEVRVPFLDHELFEFVFSLHPDSFFRKKETKFLLRENIKKVLPQKILDRPKQGFVGPDKYYMDIPWYARQLRNGQLIRNQIVQTQALEQLIKEKKHWELWKLVVLEKWWTVWKNNTI